MVPRTRDELGRLRAEDLRREAERARLARRRPQVRRPEPGREGER